ncbi:MAG: cytochrome c biogenesis protein CcdA, partial [Flavobacteriales bacterium]
VYSQNLSSDEGPLPTEFAFTLPDGVTAEGKVKEGEPHIEYDPNFMMDLAFFDGSATFTQTVKADSPVKIAGSVFFMVCDDERCLPPETVEFEVDLASGRGNLIGYDATEEGKVKQGVVPVLPNVDLDDTEGLCGDKLVNTSNVWMIFLFGFLGGLIALLTPCVFPMIPLTVSFFTKGNQSRKKGIMDALLYGFFIWMIYALLSIPFHFDAEGNALNELATSIPLNIAFFVVFVVFAISFFGYFEITLPAGFVNKVDSASNIGGFIGIFLMAVTLALVSFSCTGPILGTVLGSALKEGAWPITSAMSGFGLALGLPFALFAMFPSMMKNLPQSGGWMTSVKVVLGFIELALAVKFLSNADLVIQWHLIERETFFLIWFLLALGLALYLFTVIHFPHDNKKRKVGVWGGIVGAAALAFAIYLAPGMMKEPLWKHDVLSGFPPPACYSWYDCDAYHPPYDDFTEAQEAAIEQNKPILIDFTGWACVNCRKMEDNVWTDPLILQHLMEDFIVVSLYVDDRVELEEDEQGIFTYEVDGEERNKKIRTKGDKWSMFQSKTFNNNSQPYYVMLSPEGELLGNPTGYTAEIEEYKEYLECGLSKNNEISSK